MACGETMQGQTDPDHTHVCASEHEAGDHICSDPKCRRYFMPKGNP